MLDVFRTSGFKSDFKKLSDSDKDKLKTVLLQLINNMALDAKYKNHSPINFAVSFMFFMYYLDFTAFVFFDFSHRRALAKKSIFKINI